MGVKGEKLRYNKDNYTVMQRGANSSGIAMAKVERGNTQMLRGTAIGLLKAHKCYTINAV